MSLEKKIEALLFVSSKPLSIKKIALLTESRAEDVEEALKFLETEYSIDNRGIIILKKEESIQFATNPAVSSLIQGYLKEELSGELTRASLETLSVIAYRGPVTKIEIEQIRGVNCSLILRNLLIRGLIETKEDRKMSEKKYALTFDFLRHLGIQSLVQLPEYANLHAHEKIEDLLKQGEEEIGKERV